MSAIVNVSCAAIRTLGEIFHPCPSSRAQFSPVPWTAIPAFPFSPVKFSAQIERVFALEILERFPRFIPKPLNDIVYAPLSPIEAGRFRRSTTTISSGCILAFDNNSITLM